MLRCPSCDAEIDMLSLERSAKVFLGYEPPYIVELSLACVQCGCYWYGESMLEELAFLDVDGLAMNCV